MTMTHPLCFSWTPLNVTTHLVHAPSLFSFILKEKMKLQDERDTTSDRLQEETEFRKKMADKLSHERHQSQKEKEGTQEVTKGNKTDNIVSKCSVNIYYIRLSKCVLLYYRYFEDNTNEYKYQI